MDHYVRVWVLGLFEGLGGQGRHWSPAASWGSSVVGEVLLKRLVSRACWTLKGTNSVKFTYLFTGIHVNFILKYSEFHMKYNEFFYFVYVTFQILFVRIHMVFSLRINWFSPTWMWFSLVLFIVIFHILFTHFWVTFTGFQVIFTHFYWLRNLNRSALMTLR